MKYLIPLLSTLPLLSACSSDNTEYKEKLRAALDKSDTSLGQSVQIAQAETPGSVGERASLLTDDAPAFSVKLLVSATAQNVRVDAKGGKILAKTPGGEPGNACPDAVSLVKAIEVAEASAGGQAVIIKEDDDVACAREVQVLSGTTLWEVKVAPDGSVLEKEESDEGQPENNDLPRSPRDPSPAPARRARRLGPTGLGR